MKNLIVTLIVLFTINTFSQEIIGTDKVKDNLDKIVFVEGRVVSMRLASEGKSLNYLNLDKKYPENVFSVVITNDYLVKLNIKLEDLNDKIILVKGKISIYKNNPKQIPQIFNPESIEIKK